MNPFPDRSSETGKMPFLCFNPGGTASLRVGGLYT